MKKFIKFILGVGVAVAAIAGVMYFLKNILMRDYLEDYDDDFDNDLYDAEDADDDRDYVTINVPEKDDDENNDSDVANDTTEDDLSVYDSVSD